MVGTNGGELMRKTASDRLRSAAPFLLTEAAKEQRKILPATWGTALSILKVLQAGEWHTSSEIAGLIDKSPSHVKAILQEVRNSWALDTSNYKGYRLPKNTIPRK